MTSTAGGDKRTDWEEDRKQNRKDTIKRERMWQTVDSDEEEKRQEALHALLESDASSSSSSSSSSSGENSSDQSGGHRKKKHRGKDKKDKKDKKEKKHKKHKKDKKKRKSDRDKHSKEVPASSSLAVDQNEFGKYGVIREENFYQKQKEFEVYMSEVKNLPGIMGQGRAEVMKYFRDFMEDYNTATMPHEKYYHYDKWEMADYQRRKLTESRGGGSIGEGKYDAFDDERNRTAELKRKKEEDSRKEFQSTLHSMVADKDKRESMRRQNELKAELQLAYKQGDSKTVAKIERILAPDVEVATKHPWSK